MSPLFLVSYNKTPGEKTDPADEIPSAAFILSEGEEGLPALIASQHYCLSLCSWERKEHQAHLVSG